MNRRPKLEIVVANASPEEAAAVAAALEQFMHDTAPRFTEDNRPVVSPWKQAGLIEGVDRWADSKT